MPRFIVSDPNDLNFPYQASKFLLNLLVEKLSGRLGQEGGSFNWKNDRDFEFSVRQLEAALPTHGNFAGPGYSCGQRGEFSEDEICAALSLTKSAVKSRLHRARLHMAEQWQSANPIPPHNGRKHEPQSV